MITAFLVLSSPTIAPISVPKGFATEIDGVISKSEYAKSYQLIRDDANVFLHHDGKFLYVGIQPTAAGIASLGIKRKDMVEILHASAALGTAIYKQLEGQYILASGFTWECRDGSDSVSAMEVRAQFLKSNGWLGSVLAQGNRRDREFKIAITEPNAIFQLGIAYFAMSENKIGVWPKELSDGVADRQLITGFPPEKLSFQPSHWLSLKLMK